MGFVKLLPFRSILMDFLSHYFLEIVKIWCVCKSSPWFFIFLIIWNWWIVSYRNIDFHLWVFFQATMTISSVRLVQKQTGSFTIVRFYLGKKSQSWLCTNLTFSYYCFFLTLTIGRILRKQSLFRLCKFLYIFFQCESIKSEEIFFFSQNCPSFVGRCEIFNEVIIEIVPQLKKSYLPVELEFRWY